MISYRAAFDKALQGKWSKEKITELVFRCGFTEIRPNSYLRPNFESLVTSLKTLRTGLSSILRQHQTLNHNAGSCVATGRCF